MSRLAFRLSTGWVTEDKRNGFGVGHETGSAFFSNLAAAEEAMERFISGCSGTDDRGSYWLHDCADIAQVDDDGEMVGQPVRSWQSRPAKAEVTP